MSGKRQKNQRELAFMASGWGEVPKAAKEGTEPSAATREPESPADTKQLMEEVCQRENLRYAAPSSSGCWVNRSTGRTAVYGPVRTVVWEG